MKPQFQVRSTCKNKKYSETIWFAIKNVLSKNGLFKCNEESSNDELNVFVTIDDTPSVNCLYVNHDGLSSDDIDKVFHEIEVDVKEMCPTLGVTLNKINMYFDYGLNYNM